MIRPTQDTITWKHIVALIVSVVVLFSLTRNVWRTWNKRNVVTQREIELERIQKRHDELAQTLQEAETDGYVEKEAREKLGLSKPHERIVVIPEYTNIATYSALPSLEEVQIAPRYQWYGLFW